MKIFNKFTPAPELRLTLTSEWRYSDVGDLIYVNGDLLYTPLENGEVKAMDVPMAVSVLVHELGHHQGAKDHAKLDRLGTKIQSLLLMDPERSDFWNGNASLTVFQLNHVHSDEQKRTLISSTKLFYKTTPSSVLTPSA